MPKKSAIKTSLFAAEEREQKQLQQHGFIARGGQIVDATLVEAPKQHFHQEEKVLLEQAATPADWTPAQRRQKDTEASWTKKHGKSYHGYKLSISADRKYKLIRKRHVSTAKEHDINHFEVVLDRANTSRDAWADTRIARPRARVEHVFGSICAMGGKAIRSIGLARAEFGLSIKATVYNLRRLCSLKVSGVVPI
jgi:IS5 family transposase